MKNSIFHIYCVCAMSVAAIPVASFGDAAQAQTNSRSESIRDACSKVMGLNPSDAGYDACVVSLTRSTASTIDASYVTQAREAAACSKAGLMPGTRAFDQCILDLDQSQFDVNNDQNR